MEMRSVFPPRSRRVHEQTSAASSTSTSDKRKLPLSKSATNACWNCRGYVAEIVHHKGVFFFSTYHRLYRMSPGRSRAPKTSNKKRQRGVEAHKNLPEITMYVAYIRTGPGVYGQHRAWPKPTCVTSRGNDEAGDTLAKTSPTASVLVRVQLYEAPKLSHVCSKDNLLWDPSQSSKRGTCLAH